MSERDPLDDLIVNEDEVIDKNVIRDILSIYAEIASSGKFLPKNSYHNLTDANKMIVYLLVNKVKALKNIDGQESDRVASKTISEEAGINQKSVAKYVQRLNGIVRKDDNGYYIPNYNLSRLDFLKAIPTSKRKIPIKKNSKKTKTLPVKITEQSSIALNEEQAQELKQIADNLDLGSGSKVILLISHYLKEKLDIAEFTEADVDTVYRVLVSMRVKVAHIKYLRQTMLNMCSKSQKLGWLEKEGKNYRCSVGGQIAYNQMKG